MYLVVIVYSMWSLYGVYVESTWSDDDKSKSTWTPHRLHVEYLESTWSLQVQVGECKVLGVDPPFSYEKIMLSVCRLHVDQVQVGECKVLG
jgi:hypothetical protein